MKFLLFHSLCLQIRIRSCVHLLLFITLGVHSSKFEVNPVTDDISRLSILVRTPLGCHSHPPLQAGPNMTSSYSFDILGF